MKSKEKRPFNRKRIKRVSLDLQDETFYPSMGEAVKANYITGSLLRRAVKSFTHYSSGYYWYYVDSTP